ncbi:ankyrin repeat-containing domain protein [Dendryphion nanum]|uniref:Ankyrin repeat-containing domain protein n=1 Tax=Dendryphion nanum TaxID=256645 RepID=A0A9P9I9B5_9PLEO|nr:ankyrin repeat-containing domain protein [Dendryphion nanum]
MSNMRLDLLDLPLEIFRAIMVSAIRVRGAHRAMRLRLVNKLFAAEFGDVFLLEELSDIRNAQPLKLYRLPFFVPYIAQRLEEDRVSSMPNGQVIRDVASYLATADGDESRTPEYALHLFKNLACTSAAGVQALLDTSITVSKFDFEYAVLCGAVFMNNFPVVEKMINKTQCLANWPVCPLQTPVRALALTANIKMLDVFCAWNPWSVCEYSNLTTIAKRSRSPELVQHILTGPWNPFHTYSTIKDHIPKLHYALETPCVQILQLLCNEVDRWVKEPMSPVRCQELLTTTIRNDWTDTCKYLLSLDVSLKMRRTPGYAFRPLWYACKLGRLHIAKLLLEAGARVFITDITVAASYGHVAIIRLLLESCGGLENGLPKVALPKAAAAGLKSSWPKDTLYKAAAAGQYEIVRLLLESGMDAGIGFPPPLLGATYAEHEALFYFLWDRGARIEGANIKHDVLKIAECAGLDSMVAIICKFKQRN